LRLLVVSFERVVSWVRGEFINGAARTLDSKEHKMHGEYKTPGGKLVMADLDVRDGRLKDVEVSGDFFPRPSPASPTPWRTPRRTWPRRTSPSASATA
jgi:hypothetical protein